MQTAASFGLPGDVESLVRILTGGDQILPTTETVEQAIDKVAPIVPRRPAIGEVLPAALQGRVVTVELRGVLATLAP